MTTTTDAIDATRQQLRTEMPITERWAYFDHAAVAPLSGPAARVIREWTEQAAQDGVAVWNEWAAGAKKTRKLAAKLLGASDREVALVPNTTAGINLIAEGFDWQPGDNVVTLDDEFPSNLYPWMMAQRHGVELRQVPTENGVVDLNRFEEACDQRTRVITVSWVGYANGVRRDLHALSQVARKFSAFFFVDAIQGLGVYPIDVEALGVDGLAADGHKWLLGPEGAGVAFIRESWLDRLKPLGVGWNSVVHSGDYSNTDLRLKRTAERYEGGSHNLVGHLALGASLGLLLDLGTESVTKAVLDNATQVRRALEGVGGKVVSPTDPAAGSGIVSCAYEGVDYKRLKRLCQDDGVVLNHRGGRLRVSTHAYNNEVDVELLRKALEKNLSRAGSIS